jgi:outer membrane lipoprotein SlyB
VSALPLLLVSVSHVICFVSSIFGSLSLTPSHIHREQFTNSSCLIGNSLSSVACGDLQPSMCTMTGTSAGGFYFGTDSGNAAARPTGAAACAGLVGAVAAGVAGLGLL